MFFQAMPIFISFDLNMSLRSWPISADTPLIHSNNPLTQHRDFTNLIPNKNLKMMKRCRWNKSRCSYVVRKCISIYRQSFSQMTAMMMVVMMRAQIFFKDMFVFSGTSVWYVFSTMEPKPLHTRYKQNIMIEKWDKNCIFEWYFVNKIVLACCEKKLF